MRYFLKISYNGKNYCGWQQQPEVPTIQGTLQRALMYKTGMLGTVFGCGRTDTGVHARKYFAHFDHNILFRPEELDHLTRELNRFLPDDIVIHEIFRVNDQAHARFSVISRTYRYYVLTVKDPFLKELTWYWPFEPDLDEMNRAASLLLDYEDFTSFTKLDNTLPNNLSKISTARWEKNGNSYVFTIQANRFLRNMVRAIVGTMFRIGKGKINSDHFRAIIEGKNRQLAGESAPPHALFLEDVEYDWNQILTF